MNPYRDSLEALAKKKFVEKTDSLQLGINKIDITSKFMNLDRCADTAGVYILFECKP